VDGYVWLGPGEKGLGAHLFDALEGRTPVVGVAKNPFYSATEAVEVRRGGSERPLYTTSVGMPVEQAAAGVRSMAGPYRLPEMLKRVDRLCRDTRL
jgi:deoxyribonuclease V